MSQRTGIAAHDLSVLAFAAGKVGISTDQMGMSFRLMERHLDDAVDGNAAAVKHFTELGISMDDLKTKSPKDIFLEIAQGMERIPDPAKRAALAQELLGRSGTQLLPTMHELATHGFDATAKSATALGVVISDDTAQKALELEKAMFVAKSALMGVGNTIMVALLPALTGMLDFFGNTTDPVAKWINPISLLATAMKGLSGAAAIAGTAIGDFFGRMENSAAGSAVQGLTAAAAADYARRHGGQQLDLKTGFGSFANQQNTGDMLGQILGYGKFANAGQNLADSPDLQRQLGSMFGTGDPAHPAGQIPRVPTPKPPDTSEVDNKAQRAADALLLSTRNATEAIQKQNEAEQKGIDLTAIKILQLAATDPLQKIALDLQTAQIEATAKYNSTVETLNKEIERHDDAVKKASAVEGPVDTATLAKQAAEQIKFTQQTDAARTLNDTAYLQAKALAEATAAKAAYDLQTQNDQAYAAFHQAALASETKLTQDALDEAAKQYDLFFTAISRAGGKAFDSLLHGKGLSTSLAGLASSFADILSKEMGQKIDAALSGLRDRAAGRASQMTNADGTPMFDSSGQPVMGAAPDAGQQATAQHQVAGLQAAGAAVGLYQQGQAGVSKGANALSGAISGATIGFEVGGPYAIPAAIIGAVIGGVAGYLTGHDKQADYLGGTPQFKDGQASLWNTQNVSTAQQNQMVAQLQAAFNTAWNGFVGIMLKLPGSTLPGMPGDMSGKFQDNPSAHWAEHFQTYISDTLPRDIAERFHVGMKAAFTTAMATMTHGPVTEDVKRMLGAQFDRFWAEAANLDSATRMQFWSDMADGLASFATAAERMAGVKTALGDLNSAHFDPNGMLLQNGQSDFVNNLQAGTQGIFDQARAMLSLTGADRVAAFKSLGASMDTVTKSLSDYISHIADVLRSLKQSFGDAIFQHNLAALGQVTDINGNVVHQADPNAQARLMEARVNTDEYQIQHAKDLGLTADQVSTLSNEALGLLSQIYALDPTQAANDWWQKEVASLQTLSENSLKALGAEAKSAVDKLIGEVQPFVDWFNGLPVDLGAAMNLLTGPGGAFPGFASALDDLTQKLKEFDPNAPKAPVTPGGGGGTGGGAKTGNDSVAPGGNSTTIQVIVSGTIVGVADLTTSVKNAVIAALRQNPYALETPYARGA
jgi:hypothetical protein